MNYFRQIFNIYEIGRCTTPELILNSTELGLDVVLVALSMFSMFCDMCCCYLVVFVFSSPGQKGQVSFSHHLASGVRRPSSVVRRRRRPSLTFTKSSPLKLLGQIKPNLATIIIGVPSL